MEYRYSTYINNYNECIKLDLNEFNDDHHTDLKNEIVNSLNNSKTLTHYSNMLFDTTLNLINYISNYNKIYNYNIILSAGSDVGLEYLVNYLVNPASTVYIFVPTYSYFNNLVSKITDNIIYIPVNVYDYEYNIDSYLTKYIKNDINDENVVIYIVNPNNPTGILFDRSNIENVFIKYCKFKFIIDEAYIEYCYLNSCVEYINKYSNIFITRTFSKAYGLAGLRLGYILSSKNNIIGLYKYFNEASLSEISKVAANCIYKNIDYYENIIKNLNKRRDDFITFLNLNNIKNIKSNASFVSIFIGNKNENFIEILKSNNIYIRNKTKDINMTGFVRITIGNEKTMNLIKDIIIKNINIIDC
jgi:histidinol-phosphate aminotransferase